MENETVSSKPLANSGRLRVGPAPLLSPVPFVLVGCRGIRTETARDNLIAIAWIGTVCSDPPMLSVSIRKSRYSHALITESGEFTVNLVDKQLVKAADFCGVRSGADIDKFAACGLTSVPSDVLKHAPTVAESPLTLECTVASCQELGSHDLFLARVVGVTVRPDLFSEAGRLSLDRAGLVGYCHGEYWTLGRCLGFFGFSVADEKVVERRMKRR